MRPPDLSSAPGAPRGAARRTGAGLLLLLLAAGSAGCGSAPDVSLSGLVSRAAPFFLYHPAPLRDGRPATWGLPRADEVRLRASDGPSLHGWWLPAERSPACGAVIYFHGNAGNLAGRAEIAARYAARGAHVLLFDYRGFGKSEGSPSEEGLYRDAAAAYRHVTEERGVDPGELVLHGHSLGGAAAVAVAAREPAAGLVLTSSFRSVPAAGRAIYPWLPDFLFRGWERNRFDSESRVRRVDEPLLVARGSRDRIMPRSQVRGLYEAASPPKRWAEVPGATHNDLMTREGFWTEAGAFLAETLGCGAGS